MPQLEKNQHMNNRIQNTFDAASNSIDAILRALPRSVTAPLGRSTNPLVVLGAVAAGVAAGVGIGTLLSSAKGRALQADLRRAWRKATATGAALVGEAAEAIAEEVASPADGVHQRQDGAASRKYRGSAAQL